MDSTDKFLEKLGRLRDEEAEELAIVATESGTWSERYREVQERYAQLRWRVRQGREETDESLSFASPTVVVTNQRTSIELPRDEDGESG